MLLMRQIAVCAVLAIFLLPVVTSAQGIVPCNGPECNACHFVQLGQNILEFLIKISVIIGAVMFAVAGFYMVTSAGDTGKVARGRAIFSNVVIGLVILLAAWLIIDTVLKVFLPNGDTPLGPWNQISCVTQERALAVGELTMPDEDEGTGAIVPVEGCTNCVPIPFRVASCSPNANCNLDAAYASNLPMLTHYGLRITEGYPPTRTHQAACHNNGTCADVTIADWSPQNIADFQEDAAAAGYRAVYEPPQGVACPSGVSCLDHSITDSSGHHFSLYME